LQTLLQIGCDRVEFGNFSHIRSSTSVDPCLAETILEPLKRAASKGLAPTPRFNARSRSLDRVGQELARTRRVIEERHRAVSTTHGGGLQQISTQLDLLDHGLGHDGAEVRDAREALRHTPVIGGGAVERIESILAKR
jgi:hypothetical protein